MSSTSSSTQGWVAGLRSFARADLPAQHCDLCSAPISNTHSHVVRVADRQLVCCCQACMLLFGSNDAGKYRAVARRSEHLADFRISDSQWDALLIPIGIAFFFRRAAKPGVTALYPSPAGTTESLLDLEAWEELEVDNPVLAQLQPDVEALLVNRVEGAREYYRVSIDHCYELAGLIRAGWRGVSGGAQVWKAMHEFFAALKADGRLKEMRFHA